MQKVEKKTWVLVFLFFAGLAVSAIHPHDYFTWILEVAPGILGFIALTVTYRNFQFTYFTYAFILIHCWVLFIGGHYTYAEVPAFDWIKEAFNQSRNNYDKVGHFMQGFVPAMIIRELFVRRSLVVKPWRPFLTVCVCLSISAFYELIEWFVSVMTGSAGDAFLGTQGYVWDTQSDMLCALIGATVMVTCLARIQDRRIEKKILSL